MVTVLNRRRQRRRESQIKALLIGFATVFLGLVVIVWLYFFNVISTSDETTVLKSDDDIKVTVLTAFSENHLLESSLMVRSLMKSGYTGHVAMYLMHTRQEQPMTKEYDDIQTQFQQMKEVHQLPFTFSVHHWSETMDYSDYCFKPKIISHYLSTPEGQTVDVLMWADASTRYHEGNPYLWAKKMVADGVDYVGRVGTKLGMGENTHEKTWAYLHFDKQDFKSEFELVATHFLVNFKSGTINNERTSGRRGTIWTDVMEPWIDCGSDSHCRECMAPPGALKDLSKEQLRQIQGPPSDKYICHRQDQSVMGILVYDYIRRQRGRVEFCKEEEFYICRSPYMTVTKEMIPDSVLSESK